MRRALAPAKGFALLAALAVCFAVFAHAQPTVESTSRVDAALGDGWSRVHNPTP